MPAGGKTGGISGEDNLAFLERVALDARVSSKKILELAAKHKTSVRYEGTPLARNLNLVSRMIAGGMPTRVYYVSHGGFDTHNQQVNSHDRLLAQLDGALKSFFTDLKEQGNDKRVVLMTFSEFGRRVAENASAGTDHGKASCLFVAGPGVKGGLHGKHPSLTDLHQGDIQHTVDFRSVYGSLLSDWLKAPDLKPILGANYPKDLDGRFDFLGIGDAQLAGRDFQAGEIIAVVAQDLVETIPAAGHVVPAHIGRAAKGGSEGKIGGTPDPAARVVRGDGDESEGHIALFAEADRSHRALFRVPEEPEILPHAIPLPTAIRHMLETRLLHRRSGFGGIRKKRGIRDRPLGQPVLDRQAHPPDAGEQFKPRQEQPQDRARQSGGDAVGQEIEQAETGG
jgi:hypothetical protein